MLEERRKNNDVYRCFIADFLDNLTVPSITTKCVNRNRRGL